MELYFFFVFLATIVVTRIFLFAYPVPSPTMGKFRIHHYMYGIIGIIAGIVFSSITIYAIGVGLFIDELTFLLTGGKTHADNYSAVSLAGTLVLAVIIFCLKSYIIVPAT